MSAIMVTGAAGFIGTATTRALLELGHDVVGVDSLTDYYDVTLKNRNLKSITGNGFTFLQQDLLDMDLHRALDGVERVIHLAGQPGVRGSWGHQFDVYTQRNVLATQRLLEAAKEVGHIKKLVYASSSSIYGNAVAHPTFETSVPSPVSPYGVTKLAGEHLTRLYAWNHGVPTIALRYFTVYGPGQRPDMAFTRFMTAAYTGGPITLFGTGEQIRDFTYIDDVVRANIAAAVEFTEPGIALNVAGGSNVSMNTVLAMIADKSGRDLNIERHAAVAGDVFRTGGSTDAIQEALGWQPAVALEVGIERQLVWAENLLSEAVQSR